MRGSRALAASFLLAGWMGGGAFVACSSFDASPSNEGDGGGADGAAGDGALGADSDAAPSPPCSTNDIACDPASCGRPGHSCLGGACVSGQCQPQVLAITSATFAYGPVVDATRVVMVTHAAGSVSSRVQWCPKAGCESGLVGVDLPTQATSSRSIISDGTSAFIATAGGLNGAIYRVGQDGLARAITPLDGTFQNPDELALDGSDILFVSAYQAPPIGIYRLPSDGTSGATSIVPVNSSDRWAHLVATPGRIYVADFKQIKTCSGDTCGALDIYADPGVAHLDITGLVTDGTTLFWTSDQMQLLSCPLGASCAQPGIVLGASAFESSLPFALSIQGGDLYMTTDSGKIFTCVAAQCGTTSRRVVTDEVVEGPAAADDSAVYWLARERRDAGGDSQTYRLMRLAK